MKNDSFNDEPPPACGLGAEAGKIEETLEALHTKGFTFGSGLWCMLIRKIGKSPSDDSFEGQAF